MGRSWENGSQPEERLWGNAHNAVSRGEARGPGWLPGSCGQPQAVKKLPRTESSVLPDECKPTVIA